MKNKIMKTLKCLAACAILVSAFVLPASAKSNSDYVLIEGTIEMPIPETYTLTRVINNPSDAPDFERLKDPEDLFLNEQGYLFVVDSGNNRIVKLDSDGKLAGVFTGPNDKPLNKPQGIFADKDGNMFIADTGNYRILHLSSDGSFVEEFTRPDSEKLDKDFIFDPTKVVVSDTGYIYALKGQSLMSIDGYNNFRGYVGQSKIAFNISEMFIRMFGSREQISKMRTRSAAFYNNITLVDGNMIYAATMDTYEGELKKLNSVGTNIYKKYGTPVDELFRTIFMLSFDDIPFSYGNRGDKLPQFADVAVDDNEIVTALDKATNRLFQYDREGNLLTVFGNYGERDGHFIMPVSVVTDKEGNIYVLDKSKCNIQVFAPTAFIKNIHAAAGEYFKGDYEKAKTYWEAVLSTGENYQLANSGLAQAYFKQENWQASMDEYKLAGDRLGYSKAFDKYRHDLFRGHFFWVVIGAVALFAALGALIIVFKKLYTRAQNKFYARAEGCHGTGNMLALSLGMFFHPIDVFRTVRESRGHLKVRVGFILLLLTFAVRLIYIFGVHFPLVELDPRNANLVIEVGKMLLPPITFVIASYAVTAIVGGESKLKEIFTASCYCLMPYIVLTALLTALSHIMSRGEAGLFTFVVKASWILIYIFFLVSICVLNNYSTGKTVAVALLSVIAMVLAWIVVLLVMSLSAQLIEFITGLFREIRISQL